MGGVRVGDNSHVGAGALVLHACALRLGVPLWFCKGGIREGAVLEMVAAHLDRKS